MVISHSQAVKSKQITILLNSNNENLNDPNLILPIQRVLATDDVPAVRFLGIFLDPNLNFQYHIKLITSKLSRALYILRSSKNLLTEDALKSVYYALFHSNIIYGLPVWSIASQSSLAKLITLQKYAVRIIGNAKYNAHSEPIFKKLKILPLNQLIQFFNLQIMQQYRQGFLPAAFNKTWITNQERREASAEEDDRANIILLLRNHDRLFVPTPRLSSSAKHPYFNLPRSWSEFQNENIKIIRDKKEFNFTLKNHLLETLNSTVVCSRLLCPTCHLIRSVN